MITGRLLLLFTAVPLIELLLLVEIGERIGAGPTVLLVLATGAAGAWLARREGTRSLQQIQTSLSEGSLPARELFHGLLILLAGAFLVTPGVLTDLLGFTLLVRPARNRVIAGLRSWLEERISRGEAGWSAGAGGRGIFFSFGTGGPDRTDANGTGEPRDDGDRRRVIEM